jgi:hypothetical protein
MSETQETEQAGQELKKVSEEFVLGLLRAALPSFRIDYRQVRLVLKIAVACGYNPSSLYRRACEGRAENWEKPLLVGEVVNKSVENAPPLESLQDVKKVADGLRRIAPIPPSAASKKPAATSPNSSDEEEPPPS